MAKGYEGWRALAYGASMKLDDGDKLDGDGDVLEPKWLGALARSRRRWRNDGYG